MHLTGRCSAAKTTCKRTDDDDDDDDDDDFSALRRIYPYLNKTFSDCNTILPLKIRRIDILLELHSSQA